MHTRFLRGIICVHLCVFLQKLEDVAEELLGKSTFVGWPHLHEAKVHAVADEQYKCVISQHFNLKLAVIKK